MARRLKLVFHVEDENKNIVVEKSQVTLDVTDDIMAKAEHLSSVEDYPQTMDGLEAWQDANKPWHDIIDLMDASYNVVMKRFVRKSIIDWVKKQREPVERV